MKELAEAVRIFENLTTLAEFQMDDPIDADALVEVPLRGETSHLLLVPAAGGLNIEDQGQEITLLTPASELYPKLLGMRVGESLAEPDLAVIEVC